MLTKLKNAGFLEALLSNMQDGLVILDADRRHLLENEALRQMTGFSKEELAGTATPFPYWPPEELPNILAAFQKTISGEVTSFELIFMRKDWTRFWVHITPSELRDEKGILIGYFATLKDISERKRLENALQESEQRWRSIAENPFDFVVVIDRNFKYTYVNHTAPGIEAESLIGKATPFDFTDPVYHGIMRNSFKETFDTGKATSYDVYAPQIDAWFSSIVGAIKEDGHITSVSILTRDISQQKRAEEALRQKEIQARENEKLHAIGTLAGGIAHDLNNLLTPILSYSELIQISASQDFSFLDYVEGIQKAGLQARDLVKSILLFSRRQEPKKQNFDLGKLIREAIKLIQATVPPSIDISIEIPEKNIYVYGDPTQMHQVISNLATNGIQAMQGKTGRLNVSVHLKDFIFITVRDTGSGMDTDTKRRAFEPFFTTKPVGSGTGLGLSIVHSIVVEHGGNIEIQSNVGEGTAFIISLPIGQDISQPEIPSLIALENKRIPAKKILCVDDEPGILAIMKPVLEAAGHTVLIASNAIEAITLFEKELGGIDLLITDQNMPGMTGTSLIMAIREKETNFPCILISGLVDAQVEEMALRAGACEILPKPFLPSELLRCIIRVVEPDIS